MKLLHFHLPQGFDGQAVAAVNGACRALAASSAAAEKVRIGRAFKAKEESMISVSLTFNRAAGVPDPVFNSFTFWMLVFAVAIDDDRQRREKERRKKRERYQQPRKPKPKPPAGPRL